MAILYTNNARSTLASSIISSDLSLTVATGQGALFPSPTGGDYFLCTIENGGATGTREIVKVTARSTDTFTIVRAQDGTSASGWTAGDAVELRLTAAGLGALAPLASPALTGTPTAPTASSGDNDTSIATTAFVADAVSNLSASNTDYTPDRPPASPNAADDEFNQSDGTAIDTAGTRRSGATAWVSFNSPTLMEQRRGALIIEAASNANNMEPRGAYQALPAGDFVFECHAMFSAPANGGYANYAGVGIGFLEVGTSKMLLLTGGYDVSGFYLEVRKMTALTTWASNSYQQLVNGFNALTFRYRLARSTNTLLFSFSNDCGHTWEQVWSIAKTSDFTSEPDKVLLFANARNGTLGRGTFPYFRRIS